MKAWEEAGRKTGGKQTVMSVVLKVYGPGFLRSYSLYACSLCLSAIVV